MMMTKFSPVLLFLTALVGQAISQPVNDECPGAIGLSLDTAVTGSTNPAQPDNGFNFCGTSYTGAPGVWYEIVGTGGQFTADTCGSSYDTKLHVYEGSSCGGLTCIDGDDDDSPCGLASRVVFQTVPGETYHILVHGFSLAQGNYQLAVTESAPINDECPGAVPVALDTPVLGSTNPAQPDGGFNFCGTAYNGAPGVWYEIVGTGGRFSADTCGSSYDTKLHVYEGSSCGGLTCIGGNDDATGCGLDSRVEFDTLPGTTYHILVHGFVASSQGTYQLTVTQIVPVNDECPGAIGLSLDTAVTGSTNPAQPDGGFNFCGTSYTGAPGVWYEIVGTGGQFTADTCGSSYDTKLHVYEGSSCGGLTCIDGDDDDSPCGLASRVVFQTVPGETYHILVHGFSLAQGNYQLAVTESAPINDECPGAVPVALDTPVLGSTNPAQPDGGFNFCGTAYNGAPGVWYEIVGTGGRFSADTCGSSYDTKLHVYEGSSCGGLTCIGGNDDATGCGLDSRVEFDTLPGTTYHILVHGFVASSQGTYQLTVTQIVPPTPPNDECPGALPVSLGNSVFGNTNPAQPDGGFNFCGTTYTGAPGVWYEIVGNGRPFTADTCGSLYDTKLHVYEGSSCGGLTCVGGNDDAAGCGLDSRVVFNTVWGETYHILVHGFGSARGSYQLTVSQPPPPNDECPGAIGLALNTPVFGDTDPAQPDGSFNFCGTPYNGAPGVWYEIVGNGNQYTADTCGSEYDTKIHVYQGASCSGLTCIGGDDDTFGESPDCGLDSRVVFNTVPGETYHILVHGFGSSQGRYQLQVSGSTRTESGGDPHFTTWKQEHYEYHGQCDLVMVNDDNFADGLGIDVHIRTKLVRYWSYIKSVAIKIGQDILEIEGSADPNDDQAHYWMNYEYQGELESIAGFPVTQKLPSTYKRSYTIDLSSKYPGQDITVQLYKEFVRVKINGQETAFGKSVGLMGDYKTGKTLARDGVTVLHDFTELGDEWQVLPSDPRLFRQVSHPQFPELCIKPEDPRGDRQRRLAESEITVEQAEAACASLKDALTIKDCVYDILATQDMDMVGAF